MLKTKPTTITTAEVALLRAIVKWAKTNGYEFNHSIAQYHNPQTGMSVAWLDGEVGVSHWNDRKFTWHTADTVTQAVDMLVALRFLPAEFSSAYAQGWDSANKDEYLSSYGRNAASARWEPRRPVRRDLVAGLGR